jgi:hypothetical protein
MKDGYIWDNNFGEISALVSPLMLINVIDGLLGILISGSFIFLLNSKMIIT